MSKRSAESMLGVYARAIPVNQTDSVVIARLPKEDIEKKKSELVTSVCRRWQVLTANMFSGPGGKIDENQVAIDAMAREIGEEMAGLPIKYFELVPLWDSMPLIVYQLRAGKRVMFCCLGFNCFISSAGIEYLRDQPELQARQLTIETPPSILEKKYPLRPLLAATIQSLSYV